MKYLYPLIGLVILAGIAYISYNFGQNYSIQQRNFVIDDQTADTSQPTATPATETKNEPETQPEYTGESFINISSPTNGAIIIADSPFEVRGTNSPNVNKIVVEAYSGLVPCFEDGCCEGTEPACYKKEYKLLDRYTLRKFKPGDTTWSYKVSHDYGNAPAVDVSDGKYVVTAHFSDGTTKSSTIVVAYTFQIAEMGKPVIYLYPEKTMPVAVNVMPTSGISISEPAIKQGWNVLVAPSGKIVNSDGTIWPYLFWEGFAADFVTPEAGFVMAKRDVDKFFTDKLTYLGLNEREIADFKEFWMPRFSDNPYYFITFIDQSIFDTYAPLIVTPMPDTVIRIFFDYRGLDERIEVPMQILKPASERNGFTVIEWGGRLYR
ncbi:hypothetical protein DRH29_02065 [candidate division Kazan bacterium]|uniref:Uncharacterized protein n=1 Tax=candidate division Kazan bacterium TaxID=2202143 RepID=A0A420ZCX8_UNCK3|nr:MAG: hypothetical protein DRH29_02065 [candidate division Kazan bacterium]